jgi:hypothetical protein
VLLPRRTFAINLSYLESGHSWSIQLTRSFFLRLLNRYGLILALQSCLVPREVHKLRSTSIHFFNTLQLYFQNYRIDSIYYILIDSEKLASCISIFSASVKNIPLNAIKLPKRLIQMQPILSFMKQNITTSASYSSSPFSLIVQPSFYA